MARDANSIFRATQPEPYRILGLRLKPFSLGHFLILSRHGCSFVAPGAATATRQDLVFACLICSMDYDEFNEWQGQSPMTIWKQFKTFLSFVVLGHPLLGLKLAKECSATNADIIEWGNKVGVFDLPSKVALFQKYLAEHSASPKYWIEKPNAEEGGSHWSQNVLLTLTGELGFSQSQALNMPLREALLHFFKHAETLGVVKLMSEDEIEHAENMDKEAALGP